MEVGARRAVMKEELPRPRSHGHGKELQKRNIEINILLKHQEHILCLIKRWEEMVCVLGRCVGAAPACCPVPCSRHARQM